MRTVRLALLAGILGTLLGCSEEGVAGGEETSAAPIAKAHTYAEGKKFKIFHVMSHHSPWEWTDMQLKGFQDAMKDVPAEYRILQMDAKNHYSEEWLEGKGREARELIGSWQPDLVYASDDEAQTYVTQHYRNTALPFVFSGVNGNPSQYGFQDSGNITGVLETEHFVENVRLLKELKPSVRRIAAVFDDSPTWKPVIDRMKSQLSLVPEVEFTAWDVIGTFGEYKAKLEEYQSSVDAIALIGIFNFKEADGSSVHYRDVLRWTADHSNLPDFSFWKDRVNYGTLSAVTVSGYEQGYQAGTYAREILLNGRAPGSIPMAATRKGEPMISLARAKELDVRVNSSLLLTTSISSKFGWEN